MLFTTGWINSFSIEEETLLNHFFLAVSSTVITCLFFSVVSPVVITWSKEWSRFHESSTQGFIFAQRQFVMIPILTSHVNCEMKYKSLFCTRTLMSQANMLFLTLNICRTVFWEFKTLRQLAIILDTNCWVVRESPTQKGKRQITIIKSTSHL